MDQLFDVLKACGGNNVGTIIDLLKQSHVLDPLKTELEGKVHELLKDVDPTNISLDKFKEVIAHLAGEQGKSVEEITDSIVSNGTDGLNLDDIDLLQSAAASELPSEAASVQPSEAASEYQSEDSG